MSQTGATPPSSAPAAALRCVIWHGASAELPGELLSSLSRRIGRMAVCTDALTALAECCLIEREHRRAHAAGTTPVGGVLVLVHPRTLPDPGGVIDAVRVYAPSVAAWWYDRGANPKLRAVVEDDVRGWSSPTPAIPSPTPPAAPQVVVRPQPTRATASNGQQAHLPQPTQPYSNGSHPSPAASPLRRAPLLTEDELAMLLSDEPIDPPDHRAPARRDGGRGASGPGGPGS